MRAYFYEIQMPFYKSASKTRSHIQSTAKYIFFQAPYPLLDVMIRGDFRVLDTNFHSILELIYEPVPKP